MDRHDMGMVEPGENSGFDQKRFGILGACNTFRVGHLDGDRAIQIIVVREIHRPEPALTEPMDDSVAPDHEGIAVLGAARTLKGRLRAGRSRQAPCLIRGGTRGRTWRLGSVRLRRTLRLIHRSISGNDRSRS